MCVHVCACTHTCTHTLSYLETSLCRQDSYQELYCLCIWEHKKGHITITKYPSPRRQRISLIFGPDILVGSKQIRVKEAFNQAIPYFIHTLCHYSSES